jgi:hypothetical protein
MKATTAINRAMKIWDWIDHAPHLPMFNVKNEASLRSTRYHSGARWVERREDGAALWPFERRPLAAICREDRIFTLG